MSTFPLPLNSYAEFERLFDASVASGPASLPVPFPSKPFWTHPGLSKDWPTTKDDPDAYQTTNPYAREGSEGPLTEQADVLIVGSGITGVSIALELARLVRNGEGRKMKVVILEARDFCSGATGLYTLGWVPSLLSVTPLCPARNGGHLTASISHNYSSLAKLYDPEEVKRCFALERHTVSTLLNLIEEERWAEHIDLVDGGHNVLLFSEEERQEALEDYEKAEEAGIISKDEVKWFTPEETQKEYGTSYAMYRTAGHNLWPLKLVTKMFELARDGGALVGDIKISSREPNMSWNFGLQGFLKKVLPSRVVAEGTRPQRFQLILHTHTPVHAILPNQSTSASKWSVQTSRGTVSTNRVIYATNAYTSHLLPHLSGPQGIVPVRGQVAAIRAEVGYVDEGWEGTDKRQGISRSGFSANMGFEYWFPRPHPKIIDLDPHVEPRKPLIILGGARETLRGRGYGLYETDDSVLDAEASVGLRAFLSHVFPGKFPPDTESGGDGQGGVEVEWSGIMGFTKSGDPFVGRAMDAEGKVIHAQYIAAGFTGHGMPRAYGCAEALASLIWSDIEHVDWNPPEWLPRHYLTEAF